MPANQLEAIVENPSMRDALTTVLKRSDGGTEEIEWSDVRDTLSSGQWGRLIEQRILVDGASGFVLADPGAIESKLREQGVLSDSAHGTDTDIEGQSWSRVDKAAGVFAIVLFAGYSIPELRDVIASIDNVVLGPIDAVLPFYVIVIILATVTGLYSTWLQATLTDFDAMQRYRERMQAIQDRRERAEERGDDEALERIQEEQMEAMGDQLSLFKLQFRPMVWIMLLTIPVFLWMRWKIRAGHITPDEVRIIVPLAGSVTWQQSLVGPMPTWIVWYFLCSVAFRQLIQKTLNIQTSPST